MTRSIRTVIAFAALVCAVAAPRAASAKSQKTVFYTFDQVWPTALRFLRIDERCKLVEKDADAGYVLFELIDDGKTFSGALEIVRFVDDLDRPALRLVIRIEDRPSYMETGMLGRLERKLREDHGSPPEPAPIKRPKPDDDGKDRPKDGKAPKGGKKDTTPAGDKD